MSENDSASSSELNPTSNSESTSELSPASNVEPVTAETSQTSVRKIQANRLNARKSTGPRTDQGKARSRRNAIKHGLLAGEMVLAAPDKNGDRAEFIRMLAQLREKLKPVDILENWQVQRLAIAMWRQKLVLRSQMAKYRSQNILSQRTLKLNRQDINEGVQRQWEEMRFERDSKRRNGIDPGGFSDAGMECIRNRHENAAGARRVASFLEATIRDCSTTRLVTKEQQDQIKDQLGRQAETLLLELSAPERSIRTTSTLSDEVSEQAYDVHYLSITIGEQAKSISRTAGVGRRS